MSFDVIVDDLGCNRSDFPHSMYLVAGSQAEKPKDNCVIIMKVGTYYVKYLCGIKKEDLILFSVPNFSFTAQTILLCLRFMRKLLQ